MIAQQTHLLGQTIVVGCDRASIAIGPQIFARIEAKAGGVGQRTGKERATITNFLRLLKLPEDLQQLAAKAPPELLLALPELAAVRSGELAGLVQAVVPSLLAQLAAPAPMDSAQR